jgi:LL-diaminopimelate aminotransferase
MLRQTDLDGPPLAIYRARRDLACTLLGEIGLPVTPPQGGMYLWVPIPAGESSSDFAARLLDEAAVVVTPGSAYGKAGEGYVRMALTVPEDRVREALERIGSALARS